MRKVLRFLPFLILVACPFMVSGSGDDDPADFQPLADGKWVYGKIAYVHDLLTPNAYFMLLRGHPGNPVPLVTGGYATTDVYAIVRLRGVDTPRALQTADVRNRPHDWLSREREKWNAAMRYVWNVTEPNKTFRVNNLKVVSEKGDKVLEGDMAVYLGGEWLNLAYMLLSDGHARPAQTDGTHWDWGGNTVPLTNLAIPK